MSAAGSAPPVKPNSVTQPMAITISPAAGPLIVSSELLKNVVRMAPMMAVNTPEIAG